MFGYHSANIVALLRQPTYKHKRISFYKIASSLKLLAMTFISVIASVAKQSRLL
jgi:hypothetical protein